jgi:hypothetical protein
MKLKSGPLFHLMLCCLLSVFSYAQIDSVALKQDREQALKTTNSLRTTIAKTGTFFYHKKGVTRGRTKQIYDSYYELNLEDSFITFTETTTRADEFAPVRYKGQEVMYVNNTVVIEDYYLKKVYQLDSNTQLLQAKHISFKTHEYNTAGDLLDQSNKVGKRHLMMAIRFYADGSVSYAEIMAPQDMERWESWLLKAFSELEPKHPRDVNYERRAVQHPFRDEYKNYYDAVAYKKWAAFPVIGSGDEQALSEVRDMITKRLNEKIPGDSLAYQFFASNRIASSDLERRSCWNFESNKKRDGVLDVTAIKQEVDALLFSYCVTAGFEPFGSPGKIKELEMKRLRDEKEQKELGRLIKIQEGIADGGITGIWVLRYDNRAFKHMRLSKDGYMVYHNVLRALEIERGRNRDEMDYRFKESLNTPVKDDYTGLKAAVHPPEGEQVNSVLKKLNETIDFKKIDDHILFLSAEKKIGVKARGYLISLELFMKYNEAKGDLTKVEYKAFKAKQQEAYEQLDPSKKMQHAPAREGALMDNVYYSAFELYLMEALYEQGINPFIHQ